jgi:hypothetical protein
LSANRARLSEAILTDRVRALRGLSSLCDDGEVLAPRTIGGADANNDRNPSHQDL